MYYIIIVHSSGSVQFVVKVIKFPKKNFFGDCHREVCTVDFSSLGTFNFAKKVSNCTWVNSTTNHTKANRCSGLFFFFFAHCQMFQVSCKAQYRCTREATCIPLNRVRELSTAHRAAVPSSTTKRQQHVVSGPN